MRIIIALLFLTLMPSAARAESNYDILFGKSMWLNSARPVTAEDAKGRAVLLDFWTYGCINCMQVVPDLKALEKEFGDKLLVIGVHSAKFVGERDSDRIQAAAKRFGITHPVINDSEFKIWKAMDVKAWPTLVLLGPDGKEVGRYAGEGHREAIASELKKMGLTSTSPQAEAATESATAFVRIKRINDTIIGPMDMVADAGSNKIYWMTREPLALPGLISIGSGNAGYNDGGEFVASFNQPHGVALTKEGMYIADTGNHLIRYFDFESKEVTTIAGTGERGLYPQVKDREALKIPLASPWDIAMSSDGKTLVIAMAGLHQLWTYDIEKKTVSTLAGTAAEGIKDGAATEATLAQPSGLAVDGDTIYFVDAESSALRMLKDGHVKTLIGTGLFDYGHVDGKYPEAMLQHPQGLSILDGKIYIADTYNDAIRVYDIATKTLSTLVRKLEEPTDVLALDGRLLIVHSGNGGLSTYKIKEGTLTHQLKRKELNKIH